LAWLYTLSFNQSPDRFPFAEKAIMDLEGHQLEEWVSATIEQRIYNEKSPLPGFESRQVSYFGFCDHTINKQ
jgi:hypothetical protein